MAEVPYFIDHVTALEIAAKARLHLQSEDLPLDLAHGRVLSRDIASKVDDPPFDNSAMDGFAFIHEDSLHPPCSLEIIQTVQAGETNATQPLLPGQATRIMTGAPMPPGATSILPIEQCEVDSSGQTVTLLEQGRPHFIRKQGETLRKIKLLLQEGRT